MRLNEDGSIVSRDGSFVIHPDGTGHFASGRFKWGKDTIELRDVTIRWEDLDEEAQELLKPRSVSLTGGTAFHFKDEPFRRMRAGEYPACGDRIQFRAGKSAVGIPCR